MGIMKMAALYSGGKDSTFAVYLAEQMGHEIRFLVNVTPTDADSWLFHTPNLDIVPVMAEAMDIPLLRVTSDGTVDGDIDALCDALDGLDIDGVVTGALWSDFQWDRINKVCGTLGLVMFSPMWRKNQDMIYDEMVSAGIKSIIVGVAAEGLDDKWLGRELDAETKKDLIKLRDKYGISIMGEGGEYESLTLDAPIFKKRLDIVESEKECNRYTGTLFVTNVRLIDKT